MLVSADSDLYEYQQQVLNVIKEIKEKCAVVELDPEDAEFIWFLGLERRDKIEADFELFSQFTLLLSEIIKSEIQTEDAKEFGRKMLRWLLVQDPDYREVQVMRQCFLMGRSIDTFRIRQIELIIQKIKSSEQFKVFLTLEPSIFGALVEKHLEEVVSSCSEFSANFVSNLLVEYGSHYFKSLSIASKQKLCQSSIECLQFALLEYYQEAWLIELIASNRSVQLSFEDFFSEYNTRLPFLGKLRHAILNRATILGSMEINCQL